jgi:hypothetical protein
MSPVRVATAGLPATASARHALGYGAAVDGPPPAAALAWPSASRPRSLGAAPWSGAVSGPRPAPPLVELLPAAGGRVGPRLVEVLTDVLERRIARQVREEVSRERAAARVAPPVQHAALAEPAPVRHADNQMASVLLDQMRALLLEERFRHGVLR